MMQYRARLALSALVAWTSLSSVQAASAQDAPRESAPSELLPGDSLLAAPGSAEALKREASARFRRGMLLYQEGAFRAALVEFERANQILPDYRMLYNIAQAHWQLHDYLSAAQSYERYLAAGDAQLSAERRGEVESMLKTLRERVGRLAIHVDRAGAEVFIDERLVGVSPLTSTISVNVGRHRVYAKTFDGATATQSIDVPGEDIAELALTLRVPVASPSALAKPGPLATRRTYNWPAIGTSLAASALLAGGLFTALRAKYDADSLDEELLKKPPQESADPTRVEELRKSAKNFALATDVLLGAGLASGIASVVLWSVEREREPRLSASRARLGFAIGVDRMCFSSRF